MHRILLIIILIAPIFAYSQNKKPLTHEVYDGWLSLGERKISNNGKFLLYSINPQQGDGILYIQPLEDSSKKIMVARGYDALFSNDNNFVISKIKPFYADTRQARIKKKKPDDMPKDSLAIINLQTDSIKKIAALKSYKMPEKEGEWLAYQIESKVTDSSKNLVKKDTVALLAQISDSIIKKSLKDVKGKISKEKLIEAAQKAAKEIYKRAQKDEQEIYADADGDEKAGDAKPKTGDLILQNLKTGKTKTFTRVSDFYFDKLGNSLLFQISKNSRDSNSKAYVAVHNLKSEKTDTIMSSLNDGKNFVSDEIGSQWAFLAERDSVEKALQKFYKLWYYRSGADSAKILVDRSTGGVKKGYTVGENAAVRFSRDGRKLFFGVAPIQPPKDTTQVDFETARLDIWHYNDDYMQPQQLKQLQQESQRSFMAITLPGTEGIVQLGDWDAENVSLVDEGNADWVLAQSTKGNRIASGWEGRIKNSAYLIDTRTGLRIPVVQNLYTSYQASPNGKYIWWYNPEKKHYFSYDVAAKKILNITEKITQPLYDIENDVPDFPRSFGISGWMAKDEAILIEGVYDIWRVSPNGSFAPANFTKKGQAGNLRFMNIILDPQKRFYSEQDTLLLTAQNLKTKTWSLYTKQANQAAGPALSLSQNKSFSNILKAKNNTAWLLQLSDIAASELFAGKDFQSVQQLTNIANQQGPYNWLTAELLHWKMFDGKMSEGILYKPENFDPKKKYPVIFYFYERNADDIFSYKAPAPSASIINIPYFVSNGYIVFDPNIYYKTGQPGESAYNSVVSAAKYLGKMPWVDSTRMGIQGQSWGGYQVAYLVTRTNIFKAAGAGAPVSNMTSAYGGIRWGTGLVRQFQYEKSQSRIGATLWERPDLYIKNSPLFSATKINTPLLIMHNDADGAVPWYQGIELFSALRRLGKKVWLLQYNGEDHNLVERRNRKDLSIRLSQFFDYYLKDAKPANWIIKGLPAVEKGRTWGLETIDVVK